MDKTGPIVKTKAFIGGVCVAEDTTVKLPDIPFLTAEYRALGTLTLPMPLTDNLEAAITQIGFDRGLYKKLALEPMKFEFRFGEYDITGDGQMKGKSQKAFITGTPTTIPGGELNPGETYEGEIPISVTRYQLYVDGVETILIDKLNNILKINGKDYGKIINNLV